MCSLPMQYQIKYTIIPNDMSSFLTLAMHLLAALIRRRLSETEPKWFVFETSW